MMIELGVANWIRLVVWLLIGLVVYFLYSRNNSRVQKALVAADELAQR
jgi:APA family basic amino acid/polyamine antiporter